MNLILNIDKPKGITSHDVVNRIRRLYPNEKVGHAGTLDPLATGVLIVLVGKATKQQNEYMGQEKEYIAEIVLGKETDTYDMDGVVTHEAPIAVLKKLSRKAVETALTPFRGSITQTVPAYSAVKIKGKKLYEHARANTISQVTLPQRKVEIKELVLLDFQPLTKNVYPKAILKIVCSKGTYIRSLAHDIGQNLEIGATVANLRRTRNGCFKVDEALLLSNLEEEISNQFTEAEKEV